MAPDVIKGMIKAANSFKNSPPRIPSAHILEEEKKKLGLGEMTVYFSVKTKKQGKQRRRKE